MANAPRRSTEKTERPERSEGAERHEREFHNQPSELDEMTHRELEMMHAESSAAILFAKNIQWRSVGSALLVFGAIVAIATLTAAGKQFVDLLTILSIVLSCGVVFVLMMYQFWQLNEMNRIDEIERNFSTLFRKISRVKSRREGNVHRYTLLLFMIVVVILGAVVVNVALHQGAGPTG